MDLPSANAEPPSVTLTEAVRRGGWANLQTTIVAQGLSILTLAALYRLLQPQDYGLFALCFLASNLARVFAERGLLAAAIQAPSLNHDEQSALWWRGLQTATTAAAMLTLLGVVVEYAGYDRLIALLLATLGLSLVASAVGWQHQICLERELLFSRLARSRLFGQFAGSVAAVTAAWYGGGVWSLALQHLAECVALSLVLWWQVAWRPTCMRYRRSIIEHHITFGNRYAASGLFFWVAQNADTLLVGALCGRQVLGFYSQAYNLAMKPISLVIMPVTNLMLPALARAAATPDTFARLAISFYRFVALWHFPASVGVGLLATELMQVLGGRRWLDSAPLLAALAGMIASQGLINICGSLLAAAGKAERLRTAALIISALHMLGFVIGWQLGVGLYGTELAAARGVALSWSVVAAIVLLPYLGSCCHSAGVPAKKLFLALSKLAMSSAIMGLAVLIVPNRLRQANASAATILIISTGVGVAVYAILIRRELATLCRSAWHPDTLSPPPR